MSYESYLDQVIKLRTDERDLRKRIIDEIRETVAQVGIIKLDNKFMNSFPVHAIIHIDMGGVDNFIIAVHIRSAYKNLDTFSTEELAVLAAHIEED